MKKSILVFCSLLTLLFVLTACGASKPAGSGEPAAAAQSGGTVSGSSSENTQLPTGGESGRDATAVLTMMLEGMEEEEPVTLQTGNGWSLYLPSEGWEKAQEGLWNPTVNPDVSLEVAFEAGKTAEEVGADLTTAGNGYDLYEFTEQEPGLYTGHYAENSQSAQVKLVESAGGTYQIWQLYPDEAAEGFGARLGYLADTFQVNPDK